MALVVHHQPLGDRGQQGARFVHAHRLAPLDHPHENILRQILRAVLASQLAAQPPEQPGAVVAIQAIDRRDGGVGARDRCGEIGGGHD
ncbi:hypothetical protein G6F57_018997 [Rhizopus arrhizus]|nr:hypothetical protein G6F40_016550 [Rhizopus arrhizus]KAG1440518.1 hypothetical protein G6F57_018997 [Rhizopus arrhizus]